MRGEWTELEISTVSEGASEKRLRKCSGDFVCVPPVSFLRAVMFTFSKEFHNNGQKVKSSFTTPLNDITMTLPIQISSETSIESIS